MGADGRAEYHLSFGEGEFRCESHAYQGDLPCPWPDCQNGCDHDEVVGVLGGETRKPHSRKSYTGLGGETRYLWLGELGALFTANRRAQLQIDRVPGLERPGTTQAIYHYTDADGLLGILSSKEFWLTDYSYLSDYREVAHGVALAEGILAELRKSQADDLVRDTLDVIGCQLADLGSVRVAVCSFSLESDSLPQWRAYGNLAVGLKVGPAMLGYAPDSQLDRVIYKEEWQREALRYTLHEHIEGLQLDTFLPAATDPEFVGGMIAGRLLQRIAFFKDRAFKEEAEVRYCFLEDRRVRERLGVAVAPKRYRTAGGVVIPFVGSRQILLKGGVSPFDDAALPIIEVMVGPGAQSDILARGVRDLLDSHGYEDAAVRKSTLPYRPLGPTRGT